jgi:lipopolysaccharide transport system ATP-binding protein
VDKFVDKPVIKIENLSKVYRLGEVGTGTLSHDLNRFWRMNILGQDDPYAKVGQVNDRTQKAQKGEHISALRDINLEVKQGEVLGIIGKNGAGKSTLLKLLSRVTSPTTGSIKVKGRLASLLEVGTGFHPEMTGRENIYMNGTIMGMRRWEIDRKLDEIVEFAGVAKYLDTPTKRYSSGMTVRLGFAIAAHLEPEILVVDEVLAVGDAEFQKKAIGKMQDVSTNDGRTVLFVSHNMASVKALCTRGVILKNGELIFNGDIETAINEYISHPKLLVNNTSFHFTPNKTKPIQFLTAKIVNNSGVECNVFDVFAPVTFIIEYEVYTPVTNTAVILDLYKDGIELFRSFDSDNDESLLEQRTAGKKTMKVVIDTPLKKGKYWVNLRIGYLRKEEYDLKEEILQFEVIEDSFNPFNKGFSGDRIGVMIPQIEFTYLK